MKNTLMTLTSAAVAFGTSVPAFAQYAPPPPTQPFPGFVNDYLRKQDPYYANWDIGGSFRMRYELKENGLGLPPANDFRKTGVDNLYPANHKFYGYMDYFSWQNLHDVRAIYQMKPHPCRNSMKMSPW